MGRFRRRAGALAAALTLVTGAAQAVLYKWVDEKGHVHYGENPPPGVRAQEFPPAEPAPAPAPPRSVEDQERELQRRLLERQEREKAASPPPAPAPAPPGPPRPALVASKYLVTTRTAIDYEMRGPVLAGTVRIGVRARRENPREVWLVALFELPPTGTRDTGLVDVPDPDTMEVSTERPVRLAPNDELTLSSPLAEHFRCRTYYVTVQVFSDSSGRDLVGEHRQAIQARLDGRRIRSAEALRDALRSGAPCAP